MTASATSRSTRPRPNRQALLVQLDRAAKDDRVKPATKAKAKRAARMLRVLAKR